MRLASRFATIVIGLLGSSGLLSTADGAIVLRPPVQVSKIPDPRWRYSVDAFLVDELAFDPEIRPGDFFTIYDIPGLIDGINFVFDKDGKIDLFWAATFDFLGVTPDFSPFPPPINDDPNLLNVSFRWTGDFNIRVPTGATEIFLGNFNIVAISELDEIPEVLEYAGQTSIIGSNDKAPNAGTVQTNVIIPEPASMALMGVGVSVIVAGAGCRRLRCRSSAARRRGVALERQLRMRGCAPVTHLPFVNSPPRASC